MALPRRISRAERIADAAVHAGGLVFAALGVPALLMVASRHGGPGFAAVAVYACTLVAMIVASAVYNLVRDAANPPNKLVELLRRADHGAIFLKIAGTYTPFAAIPLGSGPGPRLLLAVWAVAGIGAVVKAVAPRRFELLSLPLYLVLGWAVLFVGQAAVALITPAALWLLGAGGMLYTVGIVFHLWDRLPFQNAIWHLHVLLASGCMYAAVMIESLR